MPDNNPPNGQFQEPVERLSKGDETSFDPIYQAWWRQVFQSVMSFGEANAADATNAAFLELLESYVKRGRLSPQKNILSLLKTIALRKAIDEWRKQNPDRGESKSEITAASKENNASDLDDLADSNEGVDPETTVIERKHLKDCLQRLPERQSIILGLLHYNDYSQTKIARLLGISDALVTSEKQAALNALRACLERCSKPR